MCLSLNFIFYYCFYSTCWIQLVLPPCTWAWDHPLGSRDRSHIAPSSHQLSVIVQTIYYIIIFNFSMPLLLCNNYIKYANIISIWLICRIAHFEAHTHKCVCFPGTMETPNKVSTCFHLNSRYTLTLLKCSTFVLLIELQYTGMYWNSKEVRG